MSQPAQQAQPETNHFDAAKLIVEALKGLDKTQQALAMRFAGETLGLPSAASAQTPQAPVTAASPAVPQPETRGATHSTDIRQFTAAKAPKSDQQFAAVVAYFYRFEASEANQKEAIDAETLREAARLADRKRLSNPLATLNNAKNSGYLDGAGSGEFRINSVGENLVAMTLPGNSAQGPPKRKARTKKVPKRKSRTTKTTKPGG